VLRSYLYRLPRVYAHNVLKAFHGLIDLHPCQHDNGCMDGRSQIKVHIEERTQVHIAQSSLTVTQVLNASTKRARRYLNTVTKSPNKHGRHRGPQQFMETKLDIIYDIVLWYFADIHRSEIGVGANIIIKQECHLISRLLHLCN